MGYGNFIRTSKVHSPGSGIFFVREWTKLEHTRVPPSSGSNFTVPVPVPKPVPKPEGYTQIGDAGAVLRNVFQRAATITRQHQPE